MNKVPWKYRNVINPWQTPREIAKAVKVIEKMLKWACLTEAEQLKLVRANDKDRVW